MEHESISRGPLLAFVGLESTDINNYVIHLAMPHGIHIRMTSQFSTRGPIFAQDTNHPTNVSLGIYSATRFEEKSTCFTCLIDGDDDQRHGYPAVMEGWEGEAGAELLRCRCLSPSPMPIFSRRMVTYVKQAVWFGGDCG